MVFSLSTFLSISGIIPLIVNYFNVPFTLAGLFVSLFILILAVTGLFLPSYFSFLERKKFFSIILLIFICSSFLQIFITDFYLALFIRLIPAFFYSSAISIALALMDEQSPKDTNKVILGISGGIIFGLSISTHIGIAYGYQSVNVWVCLINILALFCILLFFPKQDGYKRNYLLTLKHANSNKFIFSVLYILFVVMGVSLIYNYFSYFLIHITGIKEGVSFFLFANGLACFVGTSLFGYLINRKNNLPILVYPIVFSFVIIFLAFEIKSLIPLFILLIIFGLLDGSVYTISQYWICSAMREAPEFANGFFLFSTNLSKALGIIIGALLIDFFNPYYIFVMSIFFFLISVPFVLYRIKKYPQLR